MAVGLGQGLQVDQQGMLSMDDPPKALGRVLGGRGCPHGQRGGTLTPMT